MNFIQGLKKKLLVFLVPIIEGSKNPDIKSKKK